MVITIKAKMFAALFSLLIALMAVGGAGWYAAKTANDGLYTVFKDRVEPLRGLKLISDLYAVNVVDTAHKVRNGNVDWSAGQKAIAEARQQIDKLWKEFDATYMDATERKMADDAQKLMKVSDGSVNELADLFAAKDKARLERFVVERLYPTVEPTTEAIGKLVDLQISEAEKQYVSAEHKFTLARSGMIVTFILGAMVLAFSFWLIAAQVLRPISVLAGTMGELSQGNFNITVPGVGRRDEIGQIASATEMVVTKVGETIASIKTATHEVTGASVEIATATTDLSQRTEEQAASLEETSASMEQMTATVRKNADNAQSANKLAIDTRGVADRGGDVVARTVKAMAKIEESSSKISDIIVVIDEIARQTNLLALNAAVEAARAGEAGRGFAVVASEVRSLAQRSSQAAKDIKELITGSTGEVKEGVELVNEAGTALTEIVGSIKKVSEMISEIANATLEQSTGLDQINKALAQMDQVTQQNSALVEENAATAKALEDQSRTMDQQVAFFRVRGQTATQAQARAAATAQTEAVEEPAAVPLRLAAGGRR